jgi:hypothetical protein
MRHIRYLPFVPHEGDTLRFTSDDEENTIDLELSSVVYDVAEGSFICEISIDSMIDNYSEGGVCKEGEVMDTYKPFGFQRLNFPTGQAVR